MSQAVRQLMMISMLAALLLTQPVAADEPASEHESISTIRELADEVDVLLPITQLKLTEGQLKYMLGKVETLHKQREESESKEEAIFKEIKEPLQRLRASLVSGKEVPDAVDRVASAKLTELHAIRLRHWQEFNAAVASCVHLLSDGQVRSIARSPEAMRRAQQMVQQIRSASEPEWPTIVASLTSELLEVKKLDKLSEWQTEIDNLQDLPQDERTQALEDFEQRRDDSVAQMESEIIQMLINIRAAHSMILSTGVNNLASALRPQAHVQAQLFEMVGQILGNPRAKTAIEARLASLSADSDE